MWHHMMIGWHQNLFGIPSGFASQVGGQQHGQVETLGVLARWWGVACGFTDFSEVSRCRILGGIPGLGTFIVLNSFKVLIQKSYIKSRVSSSPRPSRFNMILYLWHFRCENRRVVRQWRFPPRRCAPLRTRWNHWAQAWSSHRFELFRVWHHCDVWNSGLDFCYVPV